MALDVSVNSSDLYRCLRYMLEDRKPVFVTGIPGGGKTAILHAVCDALGIPVVSLHGVSETPENVKGCPAVYLESGMAKWLPFPDFTIIRDADRPTVVDFEDIHAAAHPMQSALMQLVHARTIGQFKVSEHIIFTASSNRRKDKAGSQGVVSTLRSKFDTGYVLKADFRAWCRDFYFRQQPALPVVVPAFFGFRPEFFTDKFFNENISMDPEVVSPSPRTYHKAATVLQTMLKPCRLDIRQPKDRPAILASFAGAMGAEAAEHFTAFLQVFHNGLPKAEIFWGDPLNAPIYSGKEMDKQWVVLAMLVNHLRLRKDGTIQEDPRDPASAPRGFFEAASKWVFRLPLEYQYFWIHTATAVAPETERTTTSNKWMADHAAEFM